MGEGTATGAASIITALSNSFTTMVGDIWNGLSTILPIVLPVLGGLILLAIIIRVVQRITGRRA